MRQRLRRRQEALFAVTELVAKILERWSEAWREVLASALGAALSWFLAQRLFGHQQPIFAAISAIVCLSPGLPSHTKQTVGLLLGVATGIVVGELSLALLDDIPLLRITLAAFFAMFVATSYGQAAVVPIQAGVSAILVVAFGPAMTGSVRMIDVAVGAAVGLSFSQVLLTPDPSSRAKERLAPQPSRYRAKPAAQSGHGLLVGEQRELKRRAGTVVARGP
jgi:uncharacterized membrane protein YgaE (UPF0421/DUF939 family)